MMKMAKNSNIAVGYFFCQMATKGVENCTKKARNITLGAEIIEWDCKKEATGNRPCQSLMAVTLGPSVISCGCCPVSMTGPHT